jgi:hypothetical protein
MNTNQSAWLLIFSYVALLSFNLPVRAQEKKIMIEGNIKTQDVWREEKKVKYKFQELHFDKNGNRTEEIRFNRKGKIIFHKAFEYENDRIKREIELDDKGIIIQRMDYFYVENVLVEKKTFNGKGELVLDEQYIYTYQD